ncbi:protein kinase, partial [Myxococcota bacterium]|nr:protein kinase [Myxococcota bacterium]
MKWGEGQQTLDGSEEGSGRAPAPRAGTSSGRATTLPSALGAIDAQLTLDEDVGQFRVRRLLGEGGMGRVYLARDLVLGRLVALKLVRARYLGSGGTERFLDEARTTARFSHPNIVAIYAVGAHRGRPYLALEYLDGESLRDRLAREHLTVDESLRIARAVADALVHAHAAGVLHCDLKPGNVMLPSDGRPRVVDFGLAAEGSGAIARGIAGTPAYMAPEQWLLEPLTDRVDVWALGVLLHECLLGLHPFEPWTDKDGLRAHVLDPTHPIPPLARDGVPPEVARLVASALDRDPLRRPSAVECKAVLDRALSSGPGLGTAEAPFRGLLAFEASHAQVFFGRDAELDAFLERLRHEPVLPIIGPSGVGKSSFLHAGVVARLASRERCVV